MITLGVDPGSLITGFGLVKKETRAVKLIDFGVIRTSPKEQMPVRIKTIYDGLERLILRFHPARLSLETAFYGKNVQSALKLGQVRGAVMVLAMNHGLEFAEYSPREAKKAITGSGAAQKEQVAFMVKALLGIQEIGDFLDATDALALALCDLLHVEAAQKSVLTLQKTDTHSLTSSRPRNKTNWKSFIEQNPHIIVK
ncbi:MAG: crossover junction endodeoxyribonuclease RuvC [Chlorobiales bacterium]|nr:crossover junction endodeoxyribonuclease RuvC [Chlorobiales bacterium]